MNIIDNSKKFIAQIAQSINDLQGFVGDDFQQAAQCICASSGRLIISGVGKSGLIGRKLSATFASTGTPSHFIHPTEAAHGDMGALTRGDVLLALSKSGESAELSYILSFAKTMGIPIIAITARGDSKLAQLADYILPLSNQPEAGNLNIAPTTSTTQSLVMGDALALAVMELKGFGREDFHQFHPAGSLGLQLLQINKIMAVGELVPLVHINDDITSALHKMDGKKFGAIGVVNDHDQLLGMITDGDIRRHLGQNFFQLPISEVMTSDPLVCLENALAAEVLQRMNQKNINSMFVVAGPADKAICQLSALPTQHARVIGIIHIHHIFRAGVL